MRYLKVENNEELVRDMESKAILNTDKSALDVFNLQRRKILEQRKNTEMTNDRLSRLESDIGEIRNLLKEILRSNNGN